MDRSGIYAALPDRLNGKCKNSKNSAGPLEIFCSGKLLVQEVNQRWVKRIILGDQLRIVAPAFACRTSAAGRQLILVLGVKGSILLGC